MQAQNLTYLGAEVACLAGLALLAYSTLAARTLVTKRFMAIAVALYCLWVAIDLVAVSSGVFYFPPEGSLPIRVLGLPLEEHLFFPIHTAAVWLLILLGSKSRR